MTDDEGRVDIGHFWPSQTLANLRTQAHRKLEKAIAFAFWAVREATMFKKLLVPLDGSPLAERALRLAL